MAHQIAQAVHPFKPDYRPLPFIMSRRSYLDVPLALARPVDLAATLLALDTRIDISILFTYDINIANVEQ